MGIDIPYIHDRYARLDTARVAATAVSELPTAVKKCAQDVSLV